MKKTIFTLAAVCMALAANATILRVSNVTGSTAPYSSISAAHDAASEGDTIMVDGSNTSYGFVDISKRLVLIGPGWWLNKNGLIQEAAPSAWASFTIHHTAPGTVIEGFEFANSTNGELFICADNCVVRRCKFWNHACYKAIIFTKDKVDGNYLPNDPVGAVITQNCFEDCCITTYVMNECMSNVQITNNIFIHNEGTERDIQNIRNSYIAYNTMIGKQDAYWKNFGSIFTSTIEHNIIKEKTIWYKNTSLTDNNEWDENLEVGFATAPYNDIDIRDIDLERNEGKYGAFAGDSPYVISGIPAAPVIQDLVMPTTVEKGKKMNVTIKVGIQR